VAKEEILSLLPQNLKQRINKGFTEFENAE
jgi:hypothetical protein